MELTPVEETIIRRRSIHAYKDIPVEQEKWARIISAGMLAPSSGNVQDCRFILIEESEQRKQVAHICLDQSWMSEAPLHIVICVDTSLTKRNFGARGEQLYSVQNAAAAAQNMILAAESLGLATCWVSAFDEAGLKASLNMPPEVRAYCVLTVGYPNEEVPMPPKRRLDRTVFVAQWGGNIRDIDVTWTNYSKIVRKRIKSAGNFFTQIADKVKSSMRKE